MRDLQWNHVATTIVTAATGMMLWPCLALSGICAMIFNMNEVSATFFLLSQLSPSLCHSVAVAPSPIAVSATKLLL